MPATTPYSGIDGKILFGTSDAIGGVTDNGATVTIDLTGHDFSANDVVFITDVVGMTDLNGWHKIDSVNANDITITVATAQSYTSGGTVWHAVPIVSWSLSQTLEIKDYTDSSNVSSSSAWAVNVSSGVKRWNGSFEGIFGDGTTRPSKGTSIIWYLHMDETDNFSGSGIITGEDVNETVIEGDVTKVVYTFTGTSTLTETNA